MIKLSSIGNKLLLHQVEADIVNVVQSLQTGTMRKRQIPYNGIFRVGLIFC